MSSPASTSTPATSARFHRHSLGKLGDLRTNFPTPALGAMDSKGATIGKTFVGDALHSSSFEASVHRMLPGQGMPFFHRHKRNEEVYFVIRGRGRFVLDGQLIEVREGDFLRLDPQVERSWAAAPDEELVYLCLQVDQGSLRGKTRSDGELSPTPVPWPS